MRALLTKYINYFSAVIRGCSVLGFSVLLCVMNLPYAYAGLEIEIVGAGENKLPIAIVPFASENILAQSLSAIVAADLWRSGLFRLVDSGGVAPLPSEPSQVQYADWSARGVEALVIGTIEQKEDGRAEVRFRLLDVVKQTALAGLSYTITPGQLRITAHKIADVVYEKLTGGVGVFSTKISYIVKQGKHFELLVADADGNGAQTVLSSNEPIISPSWAPDGTRLAYVSFESKKSIIYIQSLLTGARRKLADFRGSNSAPTWSPDNKRLAIVLSKDGTSQIYLINSDGTGLQRLTNSSEIDTEPSFSPDGQCILFTSDRGGSPQIYRIAVTGGQAERLTFEGNYNVSPRYSPDGKGFAFVQRTNGRFNIATQDFASRQVQVLTDSAFDESPSYAPNGKIILFATEINRRGILSAVSSDGRFKQQLSAQSGDVREPSWGPLLKN